MWIFSSLKESVVCRRVGAGFFHLMGILLSFWVALLLRFDFSDSGVIRETFSDFCLRVLAGFFISVFAFGLYRGLWRFFTLRDCFVTSIAVLAGFVLSGGVVFLSNGFSFEGFPRSTLIITSIVFLVWEVGCRGFLRLIREHRIQRQVEEASIDRVLLVGNPDQADSMLRQLIRYPHKAGRVVGVVSHACRHKGLQLRGIPIYSPEVDLGGLVKRKEVNKLFFLPPLNTPSHIREIMHAVGNAKVVCEYQFMPSIDDLASGRLTVDRMRRVKIEDLLHRKPHEIDFDPIASRIKGQRVLVTGAGGSIGSEICRQVLELEPESLVLFESSEYGLFEIERELLARGGSTDVRAVTGDIRRPEQVRAAIRSVGGIDIVYHAAAYKHVHLMERNPAACFQNNVLGTHTVATVSEAEGVSEFVLISTDKAVRPTSLMGASKRLAERVLIERGKGGNTRFKAVRFGNVLGSSGSVIPIFRKQIENGGPVTVTSQQVTRYFMTIPEAVELVIAAGALADDRSICILEMGEPVKIDSLARRMIELSGFVPDVDIPIVYTGLKSGEKEYEELLTDDEGVVKTEYDRIWVVEKSHRADSVSIDLGDLIEVIDEGDSEALRNYAHQNISGSLLYGGRSS